MGFAGVVLAAGASERMGRPKALLDFRGRPFVVRILEALEALDIKSRVVVLGPDAARVRPSLATHECVIVENPDLAGEAIGSLRAALAALEPIRPSGIVAWQWTCRTCASLPWNGCSRHTGGAARPPWSRASPSGA